MSCTACESKKLHAEADWSNHPSAGHGFVHGQGWSSEHARAAHESDELARKLLEAEKL